MTDFNKIRYRPATGFLTTPRRAIAAKVGGALRDADVHVFVCWSACSSVARDRPHHSSHTAVQFLVGEKLTLREIYASGGGLLVTTINAIHLFAFDLVVH